MSSKKLFILICLHEVWPPAEEYTVISLTWQTPLRDTTAPVIDDNETMTGFSKRDFMKIHSRYRLGEAFLLGYLL